MNAETFDTLAWNDVEVVQERTSKMCKMWYDKQGSAFCRDGYWISKGEGSGDA